MKSVAIAEAKAKLSALVDEVRTSRKPIEIRRRDQPAVYLMEAETFKRLQGLEDSVRTVQLRQALEGDRWALEDILANVGLGL